VFIRDLPDFSAYAITVRNGFDKKKLPSKNESSKNI